LFYAEFNQSQVKDSNVWRTAKKRRTIAAIVFLVVVLALGFVSVVLAVV
jgi:hypothetical protein